MLQSKLCKICVDERLAVENDGYKLYCTDKLAGRRYWYYLHSNGNKIAFELDLVVCKLVIYKNCKVVKVVK